MIGKLFVLLSSFGVLVACTGAPEKSLFGDCPVTTPSQHSLPLPIDIEYEGRFWYGTPALWTNLPSDGIWWGLPNNGTGYIQKVVFWREGFDAISEPNPALTVTGNRLDASAPKFTESDATHGFDETGSFMLTGVILPTEGCWEITADYQDEQLSFVVLVTP